MHEQIVLYYYRHKQEEPETAPRHVVGVPMRDLTQADLDGMPEHAKVSLAASGLYYQTKPKGWKAQSQLDQEEAQAYQDSQEEAQGQEGKEEEPAGEAPEPTEAPGEPDSQEA